MLHTTQRTRRHICRHERRNDRVNGRTKQCCTFWTRRVVGRGSWLVQEGNIDDIWGADRCLSNTFFLHVTLWFLNPRYHPPSLYGHVSENSVISKMNVLCQSGTEYCKLPSNNLINCDLNQNTNRFLTCGDTLLVSSFSFTQFKVYPSIVWSAYLHKSRGCAIA